MLDLRTPREIYGELFERVQTEHVFADSKIFVDAVPRRRPGAILRQYREQKKADDFDLKSFVERNFRLPKSEAVTPSRNGRRPVGERINELWTTLTRAADPKDVHSSLIELPYPYVVPGGRFRELYYWDAYFTMLGLAESGMEEMLRNMVDNFAFLIDQIGFIPNGTRSYYGTRSQPPFFVLMVELLADYTKDPATYRTYLPQLRKEYAFWMSGSDELDGSDSARRRVTLLDGALLNRYWDDADRPREESHAEDTALASRTARDPAGLYRDIRAACESGWDFSSRWLEDGTSMGTIRTTRLLPVDLNALLHRLETVLWNTCEAGGDQPDAVYYRDRASKREALLQSRFFDDKEGLFVDVGLDDGGPGAALSLACAYPLYFGIATDRQASRVAERIERDFLAPGGWVTTLTASGQQWDAPNGWAPLQWIVFRGLRNYGFDDAAFAGANRWIDNVVGLYRSTGRLLEKYDVIEPGRLPTGGEYVVQDGFGWTNGVLLSLMKETGRGS